MHLSWRNPALAQVVGPPEVRPFRVLATSAGFEPGFRGGGPIRSVARIVDSVSDKTDLCLITRDRDFGSAQPYPELSGRWISRGRSRIFYLDTLRVGHWLRLRRELSAVPFDCLYVNSLWNPVFTVIPVIAARLRLIRVRRVMIAPRGELSPGALLLKNKKKRLFLQGWGPLLRSMDVVWHASNEVEASQIRDVFAWAHVEVNSDQVSLPEEPLPPTATNEDRARLVFIGRISPKKNLKLTLGTLRYLSKPVQFDIYGPLEDTSYWSLCQSIIREVPSFVQVKYRGELDSSEVPRTFSEYDAFIFPTLGENFGHAIAESLSASCPVVCSDRTPWTPVLERGGGAIVRDLTFVGLGKELERIAAMTVGERLRAREEAGNAYRIWRTGVHGPNILEQARLSEWALR
jgi:glycosyltransferase involved in cell wall biosynthesis